MTDAVDQRFAPPVAHVEDVTVEEDGALASRWMRFWGVLIDCLIFGGAFWALTSMGLMGWVKEFDGSARDLWAPRVATQLVGFGLLLLVNGWLLVKRGQTIGKLLCKTRIVRMDGSPVEAWRVLGLRYGLDYVVSIVTVAGMVFTLVDTLLIFRSSHRCLHDTIADTKVIKV